MHTNNSLHPGTQRAKDILFLYELSQIARFRGLVVLEDYLDDISTLVIKKGIEMIVNGTDPLLVKEYFDSIEKNETDVQAIKTIHIYSKAIRDLQSGSTPLYLLQYNAHLLENDEAEWLWRQIVEFEHFKREYYCSLTERIVDQELCQQADEILSLEFVYRTKIIISGLEWDVMARALPGCSRDIQIRIIDSMPDIEVRLMLKMYITSFPNDEEIRLGLLAIQTLYNSFRNQDKGVWY